MVYLRLKTNEDNMLKRLKCKYLEIESEYYILLRDVNKAKDHLNEKEKKRLSKILNHFSNEGNEQRIFFNQTVKRKLKVGQSWMKSSLIINPIIMMMIMGWDLLTISKCWY